MNARRNAVLLLLLQETAALAVRLPSLLMLKRAECESDSAGCEVPDAVREPPSVWMRNVQLGLVSIWSAAVLLLADRARHSQLGLLHGFTPLVWLVVLSMAGGGLMVASVVKHATYNILKAFATTAFILLTCLVTSVATRRVPSVRFLRGMGLVISSVLLYNLWPSWGKRLRIRKQIQARRM
jgi:UDP-sugar transporter A1/2/3